MTLNFREPMNAWTHLIGAVLSIGGFIAMLVLVATHQAVDCLTIISIFAFGLGLVGLYYTSFYYHAVYQDEDGLLKLKKLDHAMIFLLIAGSYTPFCLLCLNGLSRIIFISVIWSIAIVGIVLMVFWIDMPRWLNTGLYIAMGWIAVFALHPLFQALSTGGFILLILGGVMYTIGGVMYGLKRPNFGSILGFHEVFHIFVMLGSACHFAAVYFYILMP